MIIKELLKLFSGNIQDLILWQLDLRDCELALYRSRYGRIRDLSNRERISLAEIAQKIGRKQLRQINTLFAPDTLLRWYRELVRKKYTFPSEKPRVGRPGIMKVIQQRILDLATQNRHWGYGKIQGALKSLGHEVAPNTIKRVLKKHGFPPAGERVKELGWHEFLKMHKVWATDFFTHEILTWSGLQTAYVLFFIELSTRRVVIGGITCEPNDTWMQQVARNMTFVNEGPLHGAEYLIHDGDGKYVGSGFQGVMHSVGIETIKLPPRSPNLNAFAERWVRSIKDECLSWVLPLGWGFFRHCVKEYVTFYNTERPHQGIGNRLITPSDSPTTGRVRRKSRLGGLLNFYYRQSA